MLTPKYLSKLLEGLAPEYDCLITGLTEDSRQVVPGDLFFAGSREDEVRQRHILEALARGASAVLTSSACPYPALPVGRENFDRENEVASTKPLLLPVTNEQLAAVAARFYGNPAEKMTVFGITGTNGKTSCSFFIAQALQQLGQLCGVIGTLGSGFPEQLTHCGLTTPSIIRCQHELARLYQAGAKAVAMEVSSHGLAQQRVAGIPFTCALFTNLTRDHLDYHHTLENYANAKAQLFRWPGLQQAVINLDDPFSATLLKELDPKVSCFGYTLTGQQTTGLPTVQLLEWKLTAQGCTGRVSTPVGTGLLHTSLLGAFNASNGLAVLSALLLQGIALDAALAALALLRNVPGRMQTFGGGAAPLVVVDYAHTPDALAQVLQTLRAHCRGRLWCVFGCGGDRDKGKRPLMGAIAEQYSDRIIITDDNPRSESPLQIALDIRSGLRNKASALIEQDRAKAIALAVNQANTDDIVLVAGKGHEAYQLYGEQALPFSDSEQVLLTLASHL